MPDQPDAPPDDGAARRVQEERDTLRKERDVLAAAVKQQGIEHTGERWLRDKGITDTGTIDQWLKVFNTSMGQVEFKDTTELAGLIDQQFGTLIQTPTPVDVPPVDGATTPTTPTDPTANPAAPATSDPTPGFVTPSPTSTGGTPPTPDALRPTMTDTNGKQVPNPQYWEYVNQVSPAERKRAFDEGRLVFTPFDSEETTMFEQRGPRGVL